MPLRHAVARWPTAAIAQYVLLRQRAYLQQVVHQTTHSLGRFFLEVDANYKQFKTASRLRAAAAERLAAQRAYYEEGRITIDRFLDAVSQYAQAVAQEAQFKTTYNISIVALEEAKGTLLAYNNIAVAEGPHPRKAYVQARDIQNGHKQIPIKPDGPMYRERQQGPMTPTPVTPVTPPGTDPNEKTPPMPAPIGPLGPPPTPLPPYRPAGEAPILSRTPEQSAPAAADAPLVDAAAMPAGGVAEPTESPSPAGGVAEPTESPSPAGGGLPELPASAAPEAPAAPMEPAVTAPAPTSGGSAPTSDGSTPSPGGSAPSVDDLPILPESIDLPPLPPG